MRRLRMGVTMTTLLEPTTVRGSGKPPPNTFETDAPAETDEAEEEKT